MNLENLLQDAENLGNDDLKKLLKPILEHYAEGKITDKELEQIITTLHKLCIKETSNLHAPISDPKAKEMILAYQKEFGKDIVMNKVFKIDYKQISELINNQQDLVLKFAQLDIELNLLYKDENNHQRLIINQETSIELNDDAVDAFRKNFYDPTKGLKAKLDAKITKMFNDGTVHENTRQITIPYATNFNNFDPHLHSGIVLIPAIDNTTTDINKLHKITFVMYFENKIPSPLDPITYYDVFGMCPPGNCN